MVYKLGDWCREGHLLDHRSLKTHADGRNYCNVCRQSSRRDLKYAKRYELGGACKVGHALNEDTLIIRPDGRRNCRVCRQGNSKKRNVRRRERLRAEESLAASEELLLDEPTAAVIAWRKKILADVPPRMQLVRLGAFAVSQVGTHCGANHWVGQDNVLLRKKSGAVSVYCRKCYKAWRNFVDSHTLPADDMLSPEDIERSGAIDEMTKAWLSLRPKKAAQESWDEFSLLAQTVSPKCASNPGPYVDYTDPIEDDGLPMRPSPATARALCAGCPLLEACADFASKERPAWGVWGGKVYQDGRAVR